MHDLVQEMGHYIVRGEHPKNPEKHTRVWKKKDVLRICAMDATEELDMIEAIRFQLSWNVGASQLFPPVVANMKNLWWIDWEGDFKSSLPTNFPPRDLCCLTLNSISQKQLWEGNKYLPNLKMLKLEKLENLIITPNFDELPNLERLFLDGSPNIEEIDASLGRLEGLVSLRIEWCERIKKFPSVTRLKKLETLSITGCPRLFELSEIQQPKIKNLPHDRDLDDSGERQVSKSREDLIDVQNINHIRLPNLRKLDLSCCNLGNRYMRSAVWDLPNLQELNLAYNKFSLLNFSFLRLPRLKFIDVSDCYSLVELSELPSSIAVLKLDYCLTLETIGDISNCKWLWKVSLRGMNRVDGDILLGSMLKGNATEDHCISISLHHQIIQKFDVVGVLFGGNASTLRLTDDWYNDFCGFLIQVITYQVYPCIDITINEEVGEDPPFELWQQCSQAPEPDRYNRQLTRYVGYVSFSWLRRTTCFNSTYNLISFSLRSSIVEYNSGGGDRIGGALVPRKTKHHHPLQTTPKLPTDSSQFSDDRNTFRIQHDSKSSIKILWEL